MLPIYTISVCWLGDCFVSNYRFALLKKKTQIGSLMKQDENITPLCDFDDAINNEAICYFYCQNKSLWAYKNNIGNQSPSFMIYNVSNISKSQMISSDIYDCLRVAFQTLQRKKTINNVGNLILAHLPTAYRDC